MEPVVLADKFFAGAKLLSRYNLLATAAMVPSLPLAMELRATNDLRRME
jgi:hypothetical protein